MLNSSDIAGNYTNVFMVKDTANYILIQMWKHTFKDVRDGCMWKHRFGLYRTRNRF
jgi:hypothetical protein